MADVSFLEIEGCDWLTEFDGCSFVAVEKNPSAAVESTLLRAVSLASYRKCVWRFVSSLDVPFWLNLYIYQLCSLGIFLFYVFFPK